MRDDAVLGRALPLDRGLGPVMPSKPIVLVSEEAKIFPKYQRDHP